MATPARLNNPIDHKLWYITAEIEDLPVVAASWQKYSESEQVTFSLEWDELLDRIEALDQAHRLGEMTPEQQASYCALLRKLKGALPTIERLSLALPTVALEG